MSTARFQPLDLSAAPAGAVTGVERTSWSIVRERGVALGVVVLVHAVLLVTLTSSFRPHRSSAVPIPIEVRLIEPVGTFREPVPLPPIPIEPPPLESLPLPQLSIDVSPSQNAITVPVQSPPGPPRDAALAPEFFTPPQFNAAYLTNPAPTYPSMSRRLREEGTVVLRVRVTSEGQAEEIQLEHTSGFARLDEAAVGAVKHWRFVPARRGEQLVEAWVLVPVEFVLNMRALAAPSRRS